MTTAERWMLAITVDTLVDEADGSIVDGDISLRDALATASAGEIIDFSVAGTIQLDDGLGELVIDKNLTIDGDNQVTIDAGGGTDGTIGNADGFRIFKIDDGTGNPVLQDHHFHVPTYPRGLYDCAACHVNNVEIFPDATKAMATTVEAGAAPYGDQMNDILEGVQTSSCTTCHADNASKAHAWQNSWTPQAFPEGRQSIIDDN